MGSSNASTTLNAVSALTTGTVANFTTARAYVTAVVIPSGTITGGLIALEGSQDNTNWVTIHVFSPSTGQNSFHATQGGMAFRYWRCSVIMAITGGGTVKATLMYSDADGGIL